MAERPSTFLFADLAGFTALTEAHGDEEAADVAAAFFGELRALLADHGAEEVKTIGDATLTRSVDATEAVRLGLRIARDVGGRHGFLSVRVGMHTGPAVWRDGDWFGTTVNVAARVAGLAAGGQVLITEETVCAAGDLAGVDLRGLGLHDFRNVAEPVRVYEALAEGSHDGAGLPIDPVCRMAVSPSHRVGSLSWEGGEYHFCSLHCAAAFAAEPRRFAEPSP